MNDLNYKTIMWAEMKPDLYDGENCDNIRSRFEIFCDGDMSSDYVDIIKLDASTFPPGTKVLVELPCCPECGMDVELCKTYESCDFNWEEWRDDCYS